MDELNRVLLARLAAWLHMEAIGRSAVSALGIGAVCMLILVVFERRSGVDLSQYASRHFVTDVIYRIAFSVYAVLVYTPFSLAVREAFPGLNVALLNQSPLWFAIPAYLVIFDFLGYWVHRMQHSRLWWRFHRVHHSQEQLTFATGYRNHPIDQLFAHAVTFVPLLLLGAPSVAWLPYTILFAFVDATHHANLPWRFGWARKVLVSPVFHATHHDLDIVARDRNFGGLLSVWDFLFGTALDAEARPARTGVEGWRVRESWWAHLLSPFRRDTVGPPRDGGP
jgi:sterol desaturase/sphingolipid hydroxylase (fatty acid hydroxylase superfamily)